MRDSSLESTSESDTINLLLPQSLLIIPLLHSLINGIKISEEDTGIEIATVSLILGSWIVNTLAPTVIGENPTSRSNEILFVAWSIDETL